ncbi:hypothetical protein LTR95_014070, partial [Oleoguttula sp. CCFEE 5521]
QDQRDSQDLRRTHQHRQGASRRQWRAYVHHHWRPKCKRESPVSALRESGVREDASQPDPRGSGV